MKISFKDDVLPITGVGSMLGIVICLILFVWIDSEVASKIIARFGITFGIIALVSILLGRIFYIQKNENKLKPDVKYHDGKTCMMCKKPKENDGHTCCEECAGVAF